MRKIYLFIFLMVIITGLALRVNAQTNAPTTCDGSLGDPVITENFDSGTANPGPALGSQYTTMTYTTGCPDDGQYSIINSLNNSNNCHLDTWQNVLTDHTGNPNGYMMIINATINPPGKPPSVFFTEPVPTGALCPSTTYQFSAYILNLIKKSASAGTINPDITFTVTATDGTPLGQYDTGPIYPNDPSQSPWTQYSLYFTTPANTTSVIVSMLNNANGGGGNDLIMDDVTFRACGPIIQTGFTTINNTTTPTLCQGYTGTYKLVASASTSNPSYQWQTYNSTSGWVDITGANASSYDAPFVNASPGSYQYRVGIANGSAITSVGCRVYSTPLTINVNPIPDVTVSATQSPVCAGDNLQITAGGNGVDYIWSGPGLAPTHVNPLVINNVTLANAGKYTVTAYSQYGCQSLPASTQVTVNAKPAATASGLPTICQGDKDPLTASGGVSYSWSPGITLSDSTSANPIASPNDTTTYTVTVANASGCTDTKTLTVNVQKSPIANAGTDKVIFEGQSVQLTASEKYGSTYNWSPVTALSDPAILNPIASPTDDITYTLTVNSADGCGTATSSVFVKVYKKITIPNTFSPNGDGVNDDWNIDALITYPDCVLSVFDRYGQQVYHSIGYNKPWNGRYNGQLLPTGTYYYVLDLKNNTPKISGWVLIVR